MKIAVDLDGTVFQTYEKAVERYRKETGKEFHLKDFALNKDKIDDWFQEYFLTERSIDVPAYDDSIEILDKIQCDDEVIFITSRSPILKEATIKKMNYLGFYNTYFVPRKDRTKFLKDLGVDLLIEDELELALKASERNIPTILLARPWNNKKYYGNKYLIKAYDWADIFYLVRVVIWNKNL